MSINIEEDESQIEDYKVGIRQLEKSGITEAYEYVLRKLCADGLPTNNYFDLCAIYLLEFETLMKEKDINSKSLKQLIIDSQLKETKKEETRNNNNNKLRDNFVNKPIEKNLNKMNPNTIIPQNKIDNTRAFGNQRELFSEKMELKSIRINLNKIQSTNIEILADRKSKSERGNEMDNFIKEKESELKSMMSTTPENIEYTQIPYESFEINVDIVNHLSTSGNLEKFKYDIFKKTSELNENNLEDSIENNIEDNLENNIEDNLEDNLEENKKEVVKESIPNEENKQEEIVLNAENIDDNQN